MPDDDEIKQLIKRYEELSFKGPNHDMIEKLIISYKNIKHELNFDECQNFAYEYIRLYYPDNYKNIIIYRVEKFHDGYVFKYNTKSWINGDKKSGLVLTMNIYINHHGHFEINPKNYQ